VRYALAQLRPVCLLPDATPTASTAVTALLGTKKSLVH
jgi:hypothetical protein